MKRVSKFTEAKKEPSSLHCVHKYRRHWSLCGRPQDTPSKPTHSKYFRQSRKNAIMHPNGLWLALTIASTVATRFHLPPPPASVSLLMLETGTQAWVHASQVLIPRFCFFESLSPWIAQAFLCLTVLILWLWKPDGLSSLYLWSAGSSGMCHHARPQLSFSYSVLKQIADIMWICPSTLPFAQTGWRCVLGALIWF